MYYQTQPMQDSHQLMQLILIELSEILYFVSFKCFTIFQVPIMCQGL